MAVNTIVESSTFTLTTGQGMPVPIPGTVWVPEPQVPTTPAVKVASATVPNGVHLSDSQFSAAFALMQPLVAS